MSAVVDGPALRSLRESQNVPIRRIARVAAMSPGHLSKVERGEHGRPVTPRVLFAYQKVLGIDVPQVIAAGVLPPKQAARAARVTKDGQWHPGVLAPHQRRSFRIQVAQVAVGGPTRVPADKLLAAAGRVDAPQQLDSGQVDSLEQVAGLLEQLEGLAGTVAHALLGWALRLPTDGEHGHRVAAAVCRLARRAAIAGRVVNRHEVARDLYLLGLQGATTADHPDLRAGVLAEIADQHLDLGYPEEAVAVLRIAEGDERVGELVRATLKQLRVRAEQEPKELR